MGVAVTQSWAESQFYHCLAQAQFLHLQSGTSNRIPFAELLERGGAGQVMQVITIIHLGLGG